VKPVATYASFEELDIRVGRVLKVEDARTRKPTYRLTVDFGPEIGLKRSCGAWRGYTPEALTGRLVIGIVNFPVKQMGPEMSEVLILGAENSAGQIVHLAPESEVPLGAPIF
jgi:tRNA-binding protein